LISQKTCEGLNTYNYTIVTAGHHVVQVMVEARTPSSISVVISQNGTPNATSIAPAPTQSVIPLRTILNCLVGDVISIAVTSPSITDTFMNRTRTTINIHQGVM
jgi:hypothetical protein